MKMEQLGCSVDDLVDDVLLKIFSYLSTKDLTAGASKVCKRWMYIIMNDVFLWKNRLIPCDIGWTPLEFEKFRKEIELFPRLKGVKLKSSLPDSVNEPVVLEAVRRLLSSFTEMETINIVVSVREDVLKYVNPRVRQFSGVVLNQNYEHLGTWKNIEVLRLYETYDFVGRYLRVVADNCIFLKVISIVASRGILTADVVYFCEKSKERIEEIELSGYGLQDDAFWSLLRCGKLRKLIIGDLRLASKDVLLQLQRRFRYSVLK